MKKLLRLPTLFGSFFLATGTIHAQLYIETGASFFIDNGAVITVAGDFTTNANIQVNGGAGTGKIRMAGTANQNINLNGFTVPNLQMDNTAGNIIMTSAGRISNLLEFTNGKLQLGNYNLTLASTASHTGAGAARFAETNGTGLLQKEIAGAGNYSLPVGNGTNYTPLQYQLSGGAYASAVITARSLATAHPGKHPRTESYLNHYWALSNTGISGAAISAVGTYADPGYTGSETDLRSLVWDGVNWAIGSSPDNGANTVAAPISGSAMDLYAMNRFILASPKVLLQGAFNSGTGLMSDLLRTNAAYAPGNYPASNLLPTSDPYRNAPYNTTFTHVNNSVGETIATSVLNDQASPENNVVDWVFVELRNIVDATHATVVQTRSALVQRDGDLVDVDGTSPVYFKNVDAGGNYAISVRHRNHLGLSSNPTAPISLGLATTPFDFSNTGSPGSFYGTAGTHYTQAGAPLKNLLWAANANSNANVRYTSLANDKDYLLLTILNGNAGTILSNVYSQGDLNLNRTVRYTGLANDKDFLYINTLGSSVGAVRSQALPN